MIGRRRVASPPARIATGSGHDDITTLVPSKSKRKRTSSRPCRRHLVAQPVAVLRHEHQESAAARADELAADSAASQSPARTTRRFVGCSCRRSGASCAPSARASARRSARRLPLLQRVPAAIAELLDVVEVLEHLAVVLLRARILVL